MLDPDSLVGVAFRYARWLRETEQWDAMDLFSFVIHPALGRMAGMGRTRVTDLTPAMVRRALLVAAQDHIDPTLAQGAWEDFLAYLASEGIDHRPDLLDQASWEVRTTKYEVRTVALATSFVVRPSYFVLTCRVRRSR